jgi:molybdate transport system substrate-binding protein
MFSAGIVAGSQQPAEAKALIRFLTSPEAAPAIKDSGMEPAPNAD